MYLKYVTVKAALNATIREMISIDLGEENAKSDVPECDIDEVTKVLTKHLFWYIKEQNEKNKTQTKT